MRPVAIGPCWGWPPRSWRSGSCAASAAPRELKQRQVTSNAASDPVGTGDLARREDARGRGLQRAFAPLHRERRESSPWSCRRGSLFASVLPSQLVSGREPDSSPAADMADGRPAVWALPVAGGRARKILDDAAFATVSPDGTHIAFRRRGPLRLGDLGVRSEWRGRASRDRRRFHRRDPTWAVWSPNGKRLLYGRVARRETKAGPRLESCDLAGRTRLALRPDRGAPHSPLHGPAWLPDGRVVFGLTDPPPNQRDMNLWSLRVDPRSGVPSGSPRRVTQWQRLALVEPTACSADGKRLSVGALEYQSDVYRGTHRARRFFASRCPTRDARRSHGHGAVLDAR